MILSTLWFALIGLGTAIPARAEGVLSVPHFGPVGDVEELQRIEVLFSLPMVPNGEIGKRAKDGPLEFEPRLEGQFEWVSPSAVQFLPKNLPSGSEWTCRIVSKTRALDGSQLDAEIRWSFVYQRPEWLRSWVDEPKETHNPFVDDFWIEFNRPFAGTTSPFEIVTAQETLDAILRPARPKFPNRVYFRPAGELLPSTAYDLVSKGPISLRDCSLPLTQPSPIRFHTPSPARFLAAEFSHAERITLQTTVPVDSEAIRPFLVLDPTPPGGFEVRGSGRHIFIEANFPAGESIHLKVRAGAPNVYGLASESPASFHLAAPRHLAVLHISPSEGNLIPGPKEFLRLEDKNVGAVSLKAAWLSRDTFAHAFLLRAAERSGASPGQSDSLSLDGGTEFVWYSLDSLATNEWPDRLRRHDLVLSQIPNRPDDAHGIWIKASSEKKFEENHSKQGAPIQTDALLQFGTIGVSAFAETRHSLFWISDLISGKPIQDTAVSIWADSSGVLSRVWQGKSDRSGLSWGPALNKLSSPGEQPYYVRADHALGKTWLPIEHLRNSSPPPARAAFITDKDQYEPGDLVRWKAVVREVSVKGFVEPQFPRLTASINGEKWRQSARVHLNSFGAVSGQFRLPQREGLFELDLSAPVQGHKKGDAVSSVSIGTRALVVKSSQLSPLQLEWNFPAEVLRSSSSLHLQGRAQTPGGIGIRNSDVEWMTIVTPFDWTPPGDPAWAAGFRFGRLATASPDTLRGIARTDDKGEFQIELDPARWPDDLDLRLTQSGAVRSLGGSGDRSVRALDWVSAPLRLGVRAVTDPANAAGTYTFAWTCLRPDGTPVPGIDVDATLWSRSLDETDTPIRTKNLQSTSAVQTTRFATSGPGPYFVQLTTRAENEPTAETWASPALTRRSDGYLTVETSPSSQGGFPMVKLPQTPPAGSTTLWVLHQQELLSSRVLEMNSSSTLELPSIAALPGAARMTAIQVGSDPSTARHGGDARTQLPRYRSGQTTFAVPDSAWRAGLALRLNPFAAEPGDTLHLELALVDRLGRPCRGEVTLSIVETQSPTTSARKLGFRDAYGDLFRTDPEPVRYADTRQTLQVSGADSQPAQRPTLYPESTPASRHTPRDESVNPPADSGSAPAITHDHHRGDESHLSNRHLGDKTLLWNVGIPINETGVTRIRIPLPEAAAIYRVRAFGTTESNGAGGFAIVDTTIAVTSAQFANWDLPDFSRTNDLFRFSANVVSNPDLPAELRVSGAQLSELNRKTNPTTSTERIEGKVRVHNSTPALFELHSNLAKDHLPLHTARVPVHSETLSEGKVQFGVASPRATETVNLQDPEVLSATGLEIQLSPTRQSELSDAVFMALQQNQEPGIEPRLSRIRAFLLARRLAPFMSWDVDSLDVRVDMSTVLTELSPRGDLRHPYLDEPPPAQSTQSKERFFIDAFAFTTFSKLSHQGMGPGNHFAEAFELRMEQNLEQLHRSDRADLNLFAFLLSSAAEHGKEIEVEHRLRWLRAHDQKLSLTGKLYLGLSMDILSRKESRASDDLIVREANAWFQAFLDELATAPRTNGLLQAADQASLPFATGDAANVRVTALALSLLTQRSPNHQLAQPLFRALLDNRESGHWGTPQANVLAAEAISSFLEVVENLRLPAQGRVILGLSKTEGARFPKDAPSPKILTYGMAELARIRRTDKISPELQVRFETDRMSTLVYQMRFLQTESALDAPALDQGIGVYRRYTDTQNGRPSSNWKRGDLVDVEIIVATTTRTPKLWLREPIPSGAAFVDGLRLSGSDSGSDHDSWIAPDAASTQHELIWQLPPLPSGIHSLKYRILWDREGEFGVPGSVVSELHTRSRWGRAGAERVRVH